MGAVKYKPWPYQERTQQFIVDHPSAAVFLDMGMGKTVSTLSAIVDLMDSAQVARVLIVSTVKVITDVWRQEAKKWTHTKHLRFSLVHGSPSARFAALKADSDVYLINYENLTWLAGLTGPDVPSFDMLVYDESSKMKHHTAQRFKSMKDFTTERVVLLTGTPAPAGYQGLWSQFYLLDKGARLLPYVTHFLDRYFKQVGRAQFSKWTIRHGSAKLIRRRISDITISMQAKDYLELPKLIVNDVWLDMAPKHRKLYDELEKELATEINGEEVTAFQVPTMMNKCRQFTSGAVYIDEGDSKWEPTTSMKMDALADIIDDAQGTPVLVGYEYKHELERLRKRFKVRSAKEKGVVKEWNAGRVPILAAHPASAGHGLNLQYGGHILVWLTMPWSLENCQQLVKRLHRQGQRRPVVVHRLLARGTVDSAVLATLRGHDRSQQGLLDSLRAHVRRAKGLTTRH